MLGSTACARLPRKLTNASPNNSACERSSDERAKGIGALPAKRCAALGRQRFRQDDKSVKRVGKTEARGNPERQPRRNAARQSAERRTKHKAGAESRAEQTEARGAFVRRRHVGDISVSGCDARRGDAGDHPADEQPAQRRRQRHQHIVQADAEIGDEDHRAPAETYRTARPETARTGTASAPMRCRRDRRSSPPLRYRRRQNRPRASAAPE